MNFFSEDDRKRMLEILQRVDAEYKPLFTEEGEEVEDEEEIDEAVASLEERMAGLDLGTLHKFSLIVSYILQPGLFL